MTRRTDPRSQRTPPSQLPAPARAALAFTPVPRRGSRHDGWTHARQRAFIEALADTGSVHAACKAVDMSQPGAYYLRRQPGAESFAAAWQAALDLGVQRIEDTAMDRALNGVEEPLYSYGKLIGSRTRYNDRLLMFMLRNRAPDRFAAGRANLKGLNAVGKMERRRLKKKWKAKWRAAWEAEEQAKRGTVQDARRLIDTKLEELRQRVLARKREEWVTLTPETRDAYRHYEELRARDLGRAVQMPDHLPSEEDIEADRRAAEDAHADTLARRHAQTESSPQLPPPGWQRHKAKAVEEEPNPRIRGLKDENWR